MSVTSCKLHNNTKMKGQTKWLALQPCVFLEAPNKDQQACLDGARLFAASACNTIAPHKATSMTVLLEAVIILFL